MALLSINNLTIIFNNTVNKYKAVDNISFTIEEGSTTALIGQSGSGKSVTSLALMGLLPKVASIKGKINLGGKDILQLDKKEWTAIRGKDIAMVFQEPMSALNPLMTCGKQLIESIITHQKITKNKAKQIALDWLKKVKLPNPEIIIKRYPHQLSGGQKQRLMIAMAMCNNPRLLIADEPTTALDVTVQQEILALMKDLQKEYNTAILFITHDLRVAHKIADNYIILEKGKIIDKSISDYQWEQNNYVQQNEKLFRVENIKVYFEEKKGLFSKSISFFKAVDDVSFEIYKGDTLGLVGESGCGKSTISKVIMGLQQITSGKMFYNNKDITHNNNTQWRALRKKIQIIFQDPYSSLNPRIQVGEAIREPLSIYNIVEKEDTKDKAIALLESVQLSKDDYHKYPHQFSGGQRQRICIARALALQPELLICDESITALDIDTQIKIIELLKQLQEQFHLTYLFISHDLNVVKSIANRILIMQNGKIVEQGFTQDIIHYPQENYSKDLLSASL